VWAGLVGAALAGVAPDLEGWPDDVSAPTVSGCRELVWPPNTDGPASELRVRAQLGVDGRITEAQVVSGPEPLRAAALEAVATCTITPAVFDGAPAEVPLDLVVTVDPPPVSLTAVVRLRGDGGPLPNVPLIVAGREVRTDDAGRAVFRNLPAGEHAVRSGDPRFAVVGAATVRAGGPDSTAEVWWSAEQGWELVARYSAETDRPGTHVISREEIRITPGTLDDPVRAVSARPGMVRTPFDSGWLIVRGGDPGDTGLYLDGVRIPLLYHLGGFVSVVHPGFVEEVRFWPGATPARTGRQIAGAVDVVPRKLGDERRIQAGANLAFAQAYVEIPTRGGGFAAAFRRSYLDGVLALVYGPEQARIAPRFWDVQARLTGDRYALTFLGLQDGIDAPTGEDTDTIEIRQSAAQLQGRLDVPIREVELRITPWVASWERGVDGSREPQETREFFPGARVELRPTRREGARWALGAEGEYRTYAIQQATIARRRPAMLVDPYADLRVGRELRFDAGLRLETLFVDGHLPRMELSPRATVTWGPTDALEVHVEASRSHKPPDTALLIGLPDGAYLDLERSDAVGAGVAARGGPAEFTAALWTRRMRGLAGFEDDGSVDGLFGRADGLETQLTIDRASVQIRAIYQLSRSTRWEDPGGQLTARVTPWDQPHRVQLTALGRLPHDWSLAGRFRFSSGFPAPRTPTDTYDILTGATEQLGPELGRLRPFAAGDVKVTRRFLLRTWRIDAYLDLQNLGPRVFEPIITGFDDSDPAYSKGLPFLPVFGVDAVFWPRRDPASGSR
jgi:hypothetical protein